MSKNPSNLLDVNRFLPMTDIFGRTDEDDRRRNEGFKEVRVKASSTNMPGELQGRGLDDFFYVKVRLREWQAQLEGAQLVGAVREALKRELENGNQVFLRAWRVIPRASGGHVLGFHAPVDSIRVSDEKINL